MAGLVYFSSRSGNTARFVAELGLPAWRIPETGDDMPRPDGPFVLVSPTYADGQGRGAVPKPVIRFLNDPARRAGLRGVIAGGNRNFGATFALAGDVIARKCQVPVLYRFELAGTPTDVARVRAGLNKFWGKAASAPFAERAEGVSAAPSAALSEGTPRAPLAALPEGTECLTIA